jgi:hypothetical protein
MMNDECEMKKGGFAQRHKRSMARDEHTEVGTLNESLP